MSNPEGNAPHPERVAFKRLDGVVGEALSRLKELRERTEKAEAKSAELEELVRRFTKDADTPARLLTQLKALEGENEDMKIRLEKGREGVERLLARIRFLEEKQ